MAFRYVQRNKEQTFIIIVYTYRAFHNVLNDCKYLWQENQTTYLNGIVYSHRKTEKSFLTTRDVRWVHHGWHGTHRYDIQVLATHASTWVHRYSSLRHRSLNSREKITCNSVRLLNLPMVFAVCEPITQALFGTLGCPNVNEKSGRVL
jgi:hypothetical protein